MARPSQDPAPLLPRLYVLVADPGDAGVAETLRSAGESLDIAAVLLRPEPGTGDKPSDRLRPLVGAAHAIDAACLIEGNTALAAALGADGAHLDGPVALKGALAALRPHGIAGAGGLRTKHDAMTAAEAGADYVMFGEPDAGGRRPSFETTLERTDWWVQLFEPPCVGYAGSLEEVRALVAANADFIAIEHTLLGEKAALAEALAGAAL